MPHQKDKSALKQTRDVNAKKEPSPFSLALLFVHFKRIVFVSLKTPLYSITVNSLRSSLNDLLNEAFRVSFKPTY